MQFLIVCHPHPLAPTGEWQLAEAAIDIVRDYQARFPLLFAAIATQTSHSIVDARKLLASTHPSAAAGAGGSAPPGSPGFSEVSFCAFPPLPCPPR